MISDTPFKWRHLEGQIILLCVRWYLRYCLSYRDLEEMMAERGLNLDHTTAPRVINVDRNPAYPKAIEELKAAGQLSQGCQLRPVKYLNNLIERLTLPVVALSLVFALGLGAAHALSPDHGKTIMAAYLVGTRGTLRHALFLGLTVTLSHTLGVLALGGVALYASSFMAPDRLYPWLGLTSGVIILGIGVWLLISRVSQNLEQYHHHPHGQHHHHWPNDNNKLSLTWKNLTALGVGGASPLGFCSGNPASCHLAAPFKLWLASDTCLQRWDGRSAGWGGLSFGLRWKSSGASRLPAPVDS
jgi:high-affinity nickel-transport protein